MIFVAVGTFVHGFDELVLAADRACARRGLPGLAQIGHSRILPRWLAWQRFLGPEDLARAFGQSRIVVCHGGMGLLGDAMRAGRPIVAVPRRGPPSRDHPAGDQLPFLRRLAEIHPIHLCEDVNELETMLLRIAAADEAAVPYGLETDLPDRLAAYLEATSGDGASQPRRSVTGLVVVPASMTDEDERHEAGRQQDRE